MLKKALVLIALSVSLPSNAALVNNGIYTTDSTGLQWLDLIETAGITSYNGAAAVFGSVDGGGWRYASNTEVENLYAELFGNPIMNVSNGSGLFGTATAEYADIQNMHSLFGSHGATSTTTFSRGAYVDEDGILRWMGSSIYANNQSAQYSGTIFGLELTNNFDGLRDTQHDSFGVYAVRGLPEVPIPAAAWLFGSALLGLAGIKRRKTAELCGMA